MLNKKETLNKFILPLEFPLSSTFFLVSLGVIIDDFNLGHIFSLIHVKNTRG